MGTDPDKRNKRESRPTDWESLHARLEAARAAIGQELTADATREILRKRARELARPVEEETGVTTEVLEFHLSHETYAFEICWIAETCSLRDLTPLPGTPPFVLGITNVRGRIVSVIDIGILFDLPRRGLTNLNRVIILRSDGMEFGVLADEIVGTRPIRLADLQPPLATLTGIRKEYLKGVSRERMSLLDGERLLSDRQLVVHDGNTER